MYPGSELGWGQLAGGDVPLGIPVEFFKYYVFRDPNWDYRTRPIDFDNDTALADRPEIQPVNAVDPDLTKFFGRGGKLLLVDGWSDTSVPPKVAINYYKNVVAKTGAKAVKESMRFFMVPGMGHGPGTAGAENFSFDALATIEAWKKTGKAPETLVVSHYKNGMEIGNAWYASAASRDVPKGAAASRIRRATRASSGSFKTSVAAACAPE
jgi:feruloyl esterase